MCTVTGCSSYCAHILIHNAYNDEHTTVLHTEDNKVLTTVSCHCTLPDDGPVRAETCSSLCILKHYCVCIWLVEFIANPQHCNLHTGCLVLVNTNAMKGTEKTNQKETNTENKKEVKGKQAEERERG